MNHTNRSVPGREGRALAEKIMSALAGRVSHQFGPNRIFWDSLKKKSRLYYMSRFIPCDKLVENLTEHEIDELECLPFWNGNNGHEISMKCFHLVDKAIDRYTEFNRGSEYLSFQEQKELLWRCECNECSAKRSAAEDRNRFAA